MTPEQEKQIKAWEKELEMVELQIEKLCVPKQRLEQQILEAKSIFKVGDKIEWTAGTQTRRGYVTEIIEWCCGDPKWKVRLIKKDGTEGGIVQIYPWMNPKKI
jgi:hypothetical protein